MSVDDRQWMRDVARLVDANSPDGWGFIVLAAPFGENGRLVYSSNMDRKCAINVLKEWLIKASGEEEWMKHIK